MKSVFSVAFLLVIIVASLIFDGSFEREAIVNMFGSSTSTAGNIVSVPSSITGNNAIPGNMVNGSSSIPGNMVNWSSWITGNNATQPYVYGNSLAKDIKTSIDRFNQGYPSNDLDHINTMVKTPGSYNNESTNTKAAVSRILPQIIKDENILANNEYWKTNMDMTKNVNSLYSTLKFSNY